VTIAMIETRKALENLDGILDVEGLDAVFVGPSDLGQSLGYGPGPDREEPEVVEAIDRVLAAATERGLSAGIFTGSSEHASRMVEKGFRFVNVSTDVRLLAGAAAETVAKLKGE
jgi:4-hydroxy-2-oxoheptanedioate aldolase